MEKLKKLKEKVKKEEEKEEFIEVDTSLEEERKVSVRIDTLKDLADVDRILQFLREGNIIFLRIKDLKAKDINLLKKAVEKLKKACAATNSDIAGVGEDFLILTPSFARIYREEATKPV